MFWKTNIYITAACVIQWLTQIIVTENTNKSLNRNFWEEHNQWNTDIIIQYTIAENMPFLVQSHKGNNTININHSSSRLVMYNNQWSSVHRLRALNRVNNTRALFEVISPIKIQNTTRSGLVKFLTQTGYSSGLRQFTWSRPVYV